LWGGSIGRLKRIVSGASGFVLLAESYYACHMRMGWEANVAHVGEMRAACRLLVGKPEAKQGRNKEIGWEGVN
jgi:hypothetical protein